MLLHSCLVCWELTHIWYQKHTVRKYWENLIFLTLSPNSKHFLLFYFEKATFFMSQLSFFSPDIFRSPQHFFFQVGNEGDCTRFYLMIVFVCGGTLGGVEWAHMSQGTGTWRSEGILYPCTCIMIRIPGIELKSLGLEVSAFTHWAILPASTFCFKNSVRSLFHVFLQFSTFPMLIHNIKKKTTIF